MRLLMCILVLFCCSPGQSQDSLLLVKDRQITGSITDFAVDNLGNLYLVTSTNQLVKYNANGDSVAAYNDIKRYGTVSSIDVTNPFKVLVFYKDFATVVILDRLLNARNTINLRRLNTMQARTVATSYDGNIWLYDELNSNVKKIDDYGRLLFESVDLRQVFDTVPSPAYLADRDGQLYLYDARQGLYVFDYYGALKNKYELHQPQVQVLDQNNIAAFDSSSVTLLKPKLLQLNTYQLGGDCNCTKATLFNNKLYCLQPKGLIVYAAKF